VAPVQPRCRGTRLRLDAEPGPVGADIPSSAHVVRRPLAPIDGITPARLVALPTRGTFPSGSACDSRPVWRKPHRLCASLMYGSGLRWLECMSLRYQGRGPGPAGDSGPWRQGRQGPPHSARALVHSARTRAAQACRRARRERSTCAGIAESGIDDSLRRKYPDCRLRLWRWQYLFTATRTHVTADGRRQRHHLHESVVQRAFRRRRERRRDREARDLSFASPLLRHHTCWSLAPTSAPFRSYSVTRTCGRR
jgi:hypothetical protein